MNQEDFKKRYKYDPTKDRLGEGGFGEVFKAYDTFLDKWVAIKISKVKADFQELRLRNEVDILNHLPAHPNVARYEECYTFKTISGEHDFAILQFYDAGNLLQVLKKHELSLSQKYFLLAGLLEGIRFIHSQGIIHRDLKPQNVLVVCRDNQFIPKITDFGISKKLNFAKATQFSNSLIGAGTITYSSPEQLADNAIRKNTDLWSFGIIAFQVLTGETPFNSGTHSTSSELGRQEMMKQINSGKLPDSINEIPVPWKDIIIRCLNIDPDKRIKNVEGCIEMLKGLTPSEQGKKTGNKIILENDETQIATGNTKQKTRRSNSRKLNKAVYISLALILLMAVAYFIYNSKNTPAAEEIIQTQSGNLQKGEQQVVEPEESVDTINSEIRAGTITENQPVTETGKKEHSAVPVVGEIVFPNGNIYTGQLLNGKMHGKGKLWYKSGGPVSETDPMEKRRAEAGDYIEGDWNEGELYKGFLYSKTGTLKSRILIGRK